MPGLTFALLLGLVVPRGVPPAESPAELLRQAEAEFAAGVSLADSAHEARPRFQVAAERYDALQRSGASNPQLFRNLGQASLLAGDLPRAVLAYRQGLLLAPDDPALRAGLTAARERVARPDGGTLGRPPADARPPWLPHIPGGWLLAAAALAYTTAWALVGRWLATRRAGGLAPALAAFALACAAVGWLAAEQRGLPAGPLVVVADDGVLVRKGDGLAYPPRYEAPLRRGTEATLLARRGAWVQVELAGGEVGWLPRAYVLLGGE